MGGREPVYIYIYIIPPYPAENQILREFRVWRSGLKFRGFGFKV